MLVTLLVLNELENFILVTFEQSPNILDISKAELVSKDDISMLVILLQNWNIPEKFLTLFVFSFDKSKVGIALRPLNINDISKASDVFKLSNDKSFSSIHSCKKCENEVALEVSNFERSNDVNFLQFANIPEKFTTFEVVNLDKSIDFREEQP